VGPLAAPSLSENACDFINDDEISRLLSSARSDPARVRQIIAKALSKQPLDLTETAILLRVDEPELIDEIFQGARKLKRSIYGNRIVLFAPLYIGSYCTNDCAYCGFKRSNPNAVRRTLSRHEIVQQVEALVGRGHKRLILVFGEHPRYSPRFIAETIATVYSAKAGHGEIRRVNINAAPMDHEGFGIIRQAGIGAYQIFQETYHHATYASVHPAGTRKADYLWRLDAVSRAMEAGQGDVGIGALFGLYDWRFEVMGLVAHALHLQGKYGVGPHTISFPRLRSASGVSFSGGWAVSDDELKRVIATLRLAVPYTGLVLTAREGPQLRRQAIAFGVSQIDAGTRIELGGYTEAGDAQCMDREQFTIGDVRSLDEVMGELLADGYIPSFCTTCYRVGRTGGHFMEFAVPGFIQRFCTPNALTTLMEYLVDYAGPETRAAGEKAIASELARLPDSPQKGEVVARLERIRNTDARDLYF